MVLSPFASSECRELSYREILSLSVSRCTHCNKNSYQIVDQSLLNVLSIQNPQFIKTQCMYKYRTIETSFKNAFNSNWCAVFSPACVNVGSRKSIYCTGWVMKSIHVPSESGVSIGGKNKLISRGVLRQNKTSHTKTLYWETLIAN